MKKYMLAVLALAMSVTMMAQNEEKQRPERKSFDKTEMVKHRTQQMVEKYKLNKTQAESLLVLNTEFADKMAPRMFHGNRHNGQSKRMNKTKPVAPDSMKAPEGQDRKEQFEKMKETRDSYDAKLKEILSEDQFKAYKADEQNRPRRPMGGRSNRNK